MNLAIIAASTRQGRVTPRLAKFVERNAKALAPEHDWKLMDLEDYDLPIMREPLPPMANQRPELSDGTKSYLADMAEADGYIIVTPEYNHGIPAPLKNAIDLIDYQIMKKPIAIVSHGAVGGARANEQVRLIVNSNLGAVPISASLTFFGRVDELIDEDGKLTKGSEENERHIKGVIDDIVWYSAALKTAREV